MKYGDTQLASGTGFVVLTSTGPALITARHNLTGRHHETNACLSSHGGVPDSIEIFHNGFANSPNVLKVETLLDSTGAPRWIEHPQMGELCDVAMLPLRNAQHDVVLAPYNTTGNHPPIAVKVAEPVSVIGFPMGQSAGGMYAIWCTGYIASEPIQDYAGQPKFLVDCRTRPGQSGSPVVAYRNGQYSMSGGGTAFCSGAAIRPLGVYTGRIHADADIGVVWKWSVVQDLVTAAAMQLADALRQSRSALFDAAS